tara:strand:+ start:265 stop:939 length:675 start_codon:yes stop_codon:yes gene_type:complete
MIDFLNTTNLIEPIFFLPTVINFFICFILSLILREIYIRKSISLSVKSQIGSILPILSITIFLIIVVVKSSIALSLGLVGALSIVRFRTPIKEPEELIYLFIAIAIGLGFGSGQTLITLILVVSIFVIILFINIFYKQKNIVYDGFNLIITWKNTDIKVSDIAKLVNEKTSYTKIVRSDVDSSEKTLVLEVIPNTSNFIDDLKDILNDKSKNDFSISFYQSTNW